eukprot:gene49176-60194_t
MVLSRAAAGRPANVRRLRICGKEGQVQSWGNYSMMISGITGGVGCGKSTVSRLFERHGFRRLDSDALVHTRVLTDPAVIAELRARYGVAVLASDGTVDRGALARKVFGDAAELKWLENLTHPRVFALWREHFASDPR